MATVVSFVNFKGGVGKTTLCVEIAAALASHRFRERVLVIDLDPQTNATLFLMDEDDWQRHSNEIGSFYDFFNSCITGNQVKLSSLRVRAPVNHPELNSLDLMPSSLELFGIDLELATKYGYRDLTPKLFLKNALTELENDYDYILIDCPPNLYLATQNGLFASDSYVIVALAEYLSTIGISYIQRGIGDIFHQTNEALRMAGANSVLSAPNLLGIIFNKLRTRTQGTSAEEAIIARIKREYADKVFDTTVPMSTKIAERPEQKVPIAVSGYASDRVYEERIAKIAEEFYDRLTSPF